MATFLMDPSDLWVIWVKARYLQGSSFWDYHLSGRPSMIWKAIVQLRDVLADGVIQTEENIYRWQASAAGLFTLKSAWNIIRAREETKAWTNLVWNPILNSSLSWLTWRIFSRGLPTVDKLEKLNLHLVNICLLCYGNAESHAHLFFECPYSHNIWVKCCKNSESLLQLEISHDWVSTSYFST